MRRGLQHALDDYLVLLAQAGDRDAFGRLAARWTPRLAAFATRALNDQESAHDVAQDIWEAALRGLGRLEDPAKFPAWIYSIAHRKCADVLRARYRSRVAPEPEAASGDSESEAAAQLDLGAALKALPPEQRIAVSLFFGEDMSVADIATATGVSPGTVKSRLFAAREKLRAHMKGERS